ncbi:Uncharacterised protein [Serratia proteamaculans]|uniref:hypothetical protein n=1 Tax=Serratia proteamaculans TaxID=28151 RepID=UPI00217AA9F8|nr:hypothetical protein [Serratia proteamaculans]CAI2014561.1 Uncharacterised protein [Serratia proteamaculans]
MSFARLMAHFTVLKTEKNGSTTFVLAAFNSDLTGQSRTLIVDASHQMRTQANYLSSINGFMNKWECRNVVIYLNSATPSLRPSIQVNGWCFIDANAQPREVDGFELFPLVNQDPYESDHMGLYCFSPSHRRNLYEASV